VNILAVNPWIVDFAACDFWLKPYGFLTVLTYLKNRGAAIHFIDCLDVIESRQSYGRGRYPSCIIENPLKGLKVPRRLRRYGISKEDFLAKLPEQRPDYILLSSSMTYWYLGVREAARLLKEKYADTPLILGGAYATLLPEHAQKSTGCDFIIKHDSLEKLCALLDLAYDRKALLETMPCYELFYPHLEYVVLRTSWGCPFRCSFCAIDQLEPHCFRISDETILNFLSFYAKKRLHHFVFYDDALLYPPQAAKQLLHKIAALKLAVSFHTPNAMHLGFLDRDIAVLLKRTGFINPHFGLDTLQPQLQQNWANNKIGRDAIREKISLLKQAGFAEGEFSVYLLLGHPGQKLAQLKQDIEFLHSLGAKISLAEFSAVPGTKLFTEYASKDMEPLLCNNSLFTFLKGQDIHAAWELKKYTRKLNRKLNLPDYNSRHSISR